MQLLHFPAVAACLPLLWCELHCATDKQHCTDMTSVYLWRKQICKLLLKKAGVFTRFFFPAELIGIHTNTCSHMLKKKNACNAASCTCQRVQDNRHSSHVCKYKCNKYSVMIVCVHTPSFYSITSHRAQHTCARCTLKTPFFYQCVWETNARAAGVIFKSAESTCTWNSFNFSTLRILFNDIEKPVIMVSIPVCLL